jgi:hypothetical protein
MAWISRWTAFMAVGLAALLTGCASHNPGGTSTADQSPTTVPRIVGLKLRAAEQTLFDHHLRWRVGITHGPISSQPERPGIGNSLDDLPVTTQKPAAGSLTRRNAVVTIGIPCSRRHPCA